MTRRNWKRVAPRSLTHAMELCVDYGKERKNLSVERIADHMGEASHNTLYKWLATGRMPANKIRPFENACGATFVTQFIATSAGKLLIDIPTSRPVQDTDFLTLQSNFSAAMQILIRFYQGNGDADQAIAELTQLMCELAGHRARVEKQLNPELAFFIGDEE
ncbi:Uncharacterised protein [BD1-7 clade bacterium]|uniref:Uncharacterized protein n=1 Tax=BD1-7 clade bacterium TaxID=2029982 RepID=A0A5S9Q314_9GAMM|nr:Uncharacterised protein [BD1-7 clade bacterium]CAA0111905.1 Uncharacterised protein [BD1-7 clade bacterium]